MGCQNGWVVSSWPHSVQVHRKVLLYALALYMHFSFYLKAICFEEKNIYKSQFFVFIYNKQYK